EPPVRCPWMVPRMKGYSGSAVIAVDASCTVTLGQTEVPPWPQRQVTRWPMWKPGAVVSMPFSSTSMTSLGSGPSFGPSATAAAVCSASSTEPLTTATIGVIFFTLSQLSLGVTHDVQLTPSASQARGRSSVYTPPRQRSSPGPDGKIMTVLPD